MAVRYSLLMYELLLLAYLNAIGCLVAFVTCDLLGWSVLATMFVVLAFAGSALCVALALRFGQAAGIDIAHQYGLPDRAWRRAKVKTPAQFDQWLAGQAALDRPAEQGRR